MKKIVVTLSVLIMLISLSACESEASEYLYPKLQYIHGVSENSTNEGVLYSINEDMNMHYLDYESGKSTVFCFLPSCEHNDETCGAHMDGITARFLAGDKFYRVGFSENISADEGLTSSLYVSDLNRQNEKLVHTFNGFLEFGQIYLYQNTAYFVITKEIETDEIGIEQAPISLHLSAFDIKEGKHLKDIPLSSGYSNFIKKVYGVNGDKLLLQTMYLEEYIDWSVESGENAIEKYISSYYAVDINTHEVASSTSFSEVSGIDIEEKEYISIKNNFLYYKDEDKLYSLNTKTNENTLIYEGNLWHSFVAEDEFLYITEEQLHYLYNPEAKESTQVYKPEGDLMLGSEFLWHEHGEYIYMHSTSLDGDYKGYKQNWGFIIRVKKEDIYKEDYEAELVS